MWCLGICWKSYFRGISVSSSEDWLVGWLAGISLHGSVWINKVWSVGWLFGCLITRLVNWLVCWLVIVGCLVGWLVN